MFIELDRAFFSVYCITYMEARKMNRSGETLTWGFCVHEFTTKIFLQ